MVTRAVSESHISKHGNWQQEEPEEKTPHVGRSNTDTNDVPEEYAEAEVDGDVPASPSPQEVVPSVCVDFAPSDDNSDSEYSSCCEFPSPEDSSQPSSDSEEGYDSGISDTHANVWNPLYEGATVSVMTAIWLLFKHGSKHRLTAAAMEHLFSMQRFVLLPKGNKLMSYKAARQVLLHFSGIPLTEFAMCKNGCVLFRDVPVRHDPDSTHQLADPDLHPNCPTCGTARNDSPRKYTHLGLSTQLASRFWDPAWRAAVALRRGSAGPVMKSIHDSPAWNKFLDENPDFAVDDERVSLLLEYSTDGINPFKGGTHTSWPQIFKILNLPPEPSSRASLMLLVGVIHGPTSPPSLQPGLTHTRANTNTRTHPHTRTHTRHAHEHTRTRTHTHK